MSVLFSESMLSRIGVISTHGYVAADPPLGAADTGGQVVYVIELSKKLAQLGFQVDIWTRRFGDQPEIDIVNDRVRIIRMSCGGLNFIDKEYLVRHLGEWAENALRFIQRHALKYQFLNSHYWDAGFATQRLAEALDVPHVHTPHSLGLWKKQLMEKDFPENAAKFEEKYNFTQRINEETSAQDSNNDGLLEIPEDGDWTDLFGRSYNVLYDEVLWFRTNVCYGRILELMGQFDRATDYLSWSQKVRSRILDFFCTG
jgi:hypothetical protein